MQKDSAKKILHITPHLGGGVGRVILSYLSKAKDYSSCAHKVTCLDYANRNALGVAKNTGFLLLDNMFKRKQELLEMIADSDVVVINCWNHPLLYDFLVREQLPPCRLVMWGHNSGFNPPAVYTEKILTYPNLFVFTTPLSLKIKEVQNLPKERKKLLRVIWSTGGVEDVKSIKPKKHSGFNVGYIGTVDYCKMHPDFLNICNQIDIPDVNFIVCGGPNEKELKQEAGRLGIGGKFNITGPVSDINKYLSLFDVFSYPLNPRHYGTCDQTLQESMAAGVVPVVLANGMEKYMVKDGVTGIVAEDINRYVKAVQNLYRNSALRRRLSENAREYALSAFSLEKMVNAWDKVFNEALDFPKKIKKWERNKADSDISYADVFLESLGSYGKDFASYCKAKSDVDRIKAIEKIKKLAETPSWQVITKSTVHHYHHFFPSDSRLLLWSKAMKNNGFSKRRTVCGRVH